MDRSEEDELHHGGCSGEGTGISKEAADFLSHSLGATWMAVDLADEAALRALREENAQVAASFRPLVGELGVTVREEVVAGVAVQYVIPPTLAGQAIVLYLYGGAFVCGGPEDDFHITARIASQTELTVCVPRYRLAPEHPYPAAREDVRAVYGALRGKGELVVVGQSAGGNLALGMVLEAACPPLAMVLLSPWLDLTHGGESHKTNVDPTLSVRHFLGPCARAYGGAVSLAAPGVSPLFSPFPATPLPPTLVTTGSRDLLESDARRLVASLQAGGTNVRLVCWGGMWHVFEWNANLPEASRSLAEIARFIRLRVSPPSASPAIG